MSSTSDGSGRGTDTFIDLYSRLRFALRTFDDPTVVEGSLALSELFPVFDVVASFSVASLLIVALPNSVTGGTTLISKSTSVGSAAST